MAGAYSYDPGVLTTPLAQVRLIIRDTAQPLNAATAAFSDEELAFFIDSEPNVYHAAYYAALALLARAKGVEEKKVGTLTIKWRQFLEGELQEWYRRGLSHQFAEAGGLSVIDIAVLQDNDDWPRRAIERGMHDHPQTRQLEIGENL